MRLEVLAVDVDLACLMVEFLETGPGDQGSISARQDGVQKWKQTGKVNRLIWWKQGVSKEKRESKIKSMGRNCFQLMMFVGRIGIVYILYYLAIRKIFMGLMGSIFPYEGNEVQRGYISCVSSSSWRVVEPDLSPGLCFKVSCSFDHTTLSFL